MSKCNKILKLKLLQENDKEYQVAIKKGILEYILLDPAEQARIGIPLKEKVRFQHSNISHPLLFLHVQHFIYTLLIQQHSHNNEPTESLS